VPKKQHLKSIFPIYKINAMKLFITKKECFLAFISCLCLANLNAQSIQRSNVPAPNFEVTGSIYPWEVHDEGIDLILDNMTSIAGINSVYLIAVMHQEHRPFNSDKLPGTFNFIHNPIRTEWDAEDSRAYFKPHLESYGRIKPLMSNQPWLNDTDWLKIVLDKAHARGLRAGVEVSHTYIPVEVLTNHPEYKQRDINDKTVDRPCTNNPEVREYLLALYGDLAKNYDVDYIQTCMLLFSRSDDPTHGGTCFCESCKHKAKSMGFDMEAAIPVLKDNPYAQPQLDNWRNFRKACTTEIYKLVTDKIHQENPKIDFRLNDLNDRTSGLALEELKNNINSVHLSTHTEQNGYQKSDRKSRIATTKYFMGNDVPIIPGVPTRLLTTVPIVKSSIKISVDGGAKGIGVKHYDGSPYSMLRAVRNGISEAGVPGFTPIMGMEVEEMNLSGYNPDKFLIEQCVQTTGTGTATSAFANPSGLYTIVVSYADEKEGQGNLALYVGGKQKATWKLTEDVGCWRRKTIPNIKINSGDEIKLIGMANGSESARVDFIEFIPQATSEKGKKK
jgi:hypothetical protein